MNNRKELSAERARELLHYDVENGIFTARIRSANRMAGTILGCVKDNGYLVIGADGRQYYAHRLAWLIAHGAWPSGHIDHLDGNRKNNAIANLRCVTQATNCENRRRASHANKVGLLGVTRLSGRYRATITYRHKSHHLGMFPTAEEAHAAYVAKKRELHSGCTL